MIQSSVQLKKDLDRERPCRLDVTVKQFYVLMIKLEDFFKRFGFTGHLLAKRFVEQAVYSGVVNGLIAHYITPPKKRKLRHEAERTSARPLDCHAKFIERDGT